MEKNNLKKYISILFGFLMFSYIFYLRILRSYLPRELPLELFSSGNYFQLGIYFYLFFAFSYFTILFARICFFPESIREPNFIAKFFIKISSFIDKSLENFYFWAIENRISSEYQYNIPKTIGVFLYTYFRWYKRPLLLHILFVYIPNIIVLICLFIDVFFYKEFHYVYFASILLIITLMESFLVYLLTRFCKINMEKLDKDLIILNLKTKERLTCENLQKIQSNSKTKLTAQDIQYSMSQEFLEEAKKEDYDVYETLKLYAKSLNSEILPTYFFVILYKAFKLKYMLYFACCNFISFFCYSIIWGYVLYYSF